MGELEKQMMKDHARRVRALADGKAKDATITRLSSELAASRDREMALERERDDWRADCLRRNNDALERGLALRAAEAEVKRLKRLVGLLREDLIRACEGDYQLCEGCGAPIFVEDDEIATVEEVKGCWGYVADVKNTPCWRYRTQQGEDRSWPDCRALATTGLQGGGE